MNWRTISLCLVFLTLLCYRYSSAQTASEWFERALQETDLKKKISYYDQAIRLDPKDADAYYNRGNAKYDLGQYEAAIRDYDQAIRLDPKDADAYFNRGNAKDDMGQYEAAIQDYDQAIRLNPKDAHAYNNRGSAKNDLGQYEAAIRDYDQAIRLDPKYTTAYCNRGGTKDDLGQYEAAIRDYDQAIQLDPKYATAYYNRGSAKDDLGQYEAAIRDYDQAIKLDPKDADAYNNRGVSKKNLGHYESAIQDYDQAIRLDPKDAYAYNNRGSAKNDLGQYEAAIRDYDQAIRLDAKYAAAYNNRGVSKKNLGQYESAIRDYDQALRLDPDFALAESNRQKALQLLRGEKTTNSPTVHAVAVGIDVYQHDYLLSPLLAPENQANQMARFLEVRGLTDNREVTVLTGSNARRERILAALKRTFTGPQVGPDDLVIFYFSGHGLALNQQAGGICPYDYSSSGQLITDREIIDLLEASPAKHKICFIESCKSASNSYAGIPKTSLQRFHENRRLIPGGVVFITSTEPGEKSYETSEKGGFFSYYLFLGLGGRADRNQDNLVTVRELYDYLKENVAADTNQEQVPQINREGYRLDVPVMVVR